MGCHIALPTDIAELTPAYLTTALRHGGHLADGAVSSVEAAPLGAGVGFVGQANERGRQLLDCLGMRSCQALADYGCTGLRTG